MIGYQLDVDIDKLALTRQYPLFAFKYVFFSSMQTSTSVQLAVITVTRMHSALTQRGVSPALVMQATLEMESPAQVRYMYQNYI